MRGPKERFGLPDECPMVTEGLIFQLLRRFTRAIWVAVVTGWEISALLMDVVRSASKAEPG